MVPSEGLEPSEAVRPGDLQSPAIAATRTRRKGLFQNLIFSIKSTVLSRYGALW